MYLFGAIKLLLKFDTSAALSATVTHPAEMNGVPIARGLHKLATVEVYFPFFCGVGVDNKATVERDVGHYVEFLACLGHSLGEKSWMV